MSPIRRAPLPQQFLVPARRVARGGARRAAVQLGYTALAITDECSLAGVVRAHSAVKKLGAAKLP